MSRSTPIPYFPVPPQTYEHQYMAELVRAIALYAQQSTNPGEGRNTFTVFTNLQSGSDAGLETGAVFHVDGVLKVVVSRLPHVSGLSGTAAVGTVTVSTP